MRKVWRSHIITMIPSHITTTTTSDKFLYHLWINSCTIYVNMTFNLLGYSVVFVIFQFDS